MGFFDAIGGLFGGAGGKLDVRKRFDVQDRLSAGTMSELFRVVERSSGKKFALKLLDVKKTADFEARFKSLKKPSEGVIATAIKSPHVVQTFEHGQTTEGKAFLLMELLPGDDLQFVINARLPSLKGKRWPLIKQMADALKAVHEAGYIHRDVCPHNFLLHPSIESVKLIDFGLSVPNKPEFCTPGNRTGKADYMAPELIRRQPTDLRIDVFAFGASVFQMFVGRLPWDSGGGELASRRAGQEAADLQKFVPNIEPKLAKVVKDCLQPEPSDRCPNFDEFFKRLKGVERETVA